MKTLLVFFVIVLLILSFIIMFDLIMGTSLTMSLRNIANPFWVMTGPEYAIAFGLLFTVFTAPVVSFVKQLKKRKADQKS